MIAKSIPKFAALLVCAAFVCPNLMAQPRDEISTAGEEILSTSLPQNHLVFNAFVPTLEGIDEAKTDPAAPLGPAPFLPPRPGFWRTAESSLFATSLISFAALNVADYFLTREALKYPETIETNPVLRPIVKNAATFALFKAGFVVLNTFGLAGLHRSDKPMAWVLSLATNVLVGLAVSHNLSQLEKVRTRQP